MFIKKFLILTLFIILIYPISCFSAPWINMNITYNGKTEKYNAENVYLYVNGKRVENLPMPPIIFEGTTLVPAREVFEPLGANVDWKKDTQEVVVTYNNHSIIIKINSETASVDNKIMPLTIPARIINSKTLIPARFIAQSIGLKVEWNADTRIINIREMPPEQVPVLDISEETTTQTTTEIITETTTETTTIMTTTEQSTESTIERPPSDLNEPKCKDGVLKITANGEIGDFALPEIKNKKITYILSRTNLPPKESYSFDDDYIKKVDFEEITINDRKLTQIILYLREKSKPIAYISKDSKSFIVDFVNKAPEFDDLYVVEGDSDEPLASDSDIPSDITGNAGGSTGVSNSQKPSAPSTSLNEIPIDKNVFFKDNNLYIKKNSSFKINNIKENDNYQYREYTIDAGCSLADSVTQGRYTINNDKINYVEITHSNTTSIKISEKKIYAYNITENSEYICINPILPKQKYKKIVVIDAGHGGSDPGAESASNNIIEKDLTLSVAKKTVAAIEKDGSIKVYAVRLDDTYYTRPDRAAFGDEMGDMFISIHANSFSAERANGIEVWYYPHENDKTIGVSCKELAETLQRNLIANLNATDRGIKSTDYDVLAFTHIPASLCEIGFITNPSEASKLNSSEYQNLIADAIYKSIAEIFKKYTPQR